MKVILLRTRILESNKIYKFTKLNKENLFMINHFPIAKWLQYGKRVCVTTLPPTWQRLEIHKCNAYQLSINFISVVSAAIFSPFTRLMNRRGKKKEIGIAFESRPENAILSTVFRKHSRVAYSLVVKNNVRQPYVFRWYMKGVNTAIVVRIPL